MRLKDFEIKVIKDAVYSFDKSARIYLFGSRVDNSKRGGDIDLIIASDIITKKDIFKIKSKIFEKLDEQKIDMLIVNQNDTYKYDSDKTFLNLVKKQRVQI